MSNEESVALDGRIEEALEPLRERIAELEKRLAQLERERMRNLQVGFGSCN